VSIRPVGSCTQVGTSGTVLEPGARDDSAEIHRRLYAAGLAVDALDGFEYVPAIPRPGDPALLSRPGWAARLARHHHTETGEAALRPPGKPLRYRIENRRAVPVSAAIQTARAARTRAILEHVTTHPRCSKGSVEKAVGGRAADVRAALLDLLAHGKSPGRGPRRALHLVGQ
jgi:hypothetical protein